MKPLMRSILSKNSTSRIAESTKLYSLFSKLLECIKRYNFVLDDEMRWMSKISVIERAFHLYKPSSGITNSIVEDVDDIFRDSKVDFEKRIDYEDNKYVKSVPSQKITHNYTIKLKDYDSYVSFLINICYYKSHNEINCSIVLPEEYEELFED